MRTKINKLKKEHLSKLLKQHQVLSFPNDFDLVYEKQIPNTVVALVEGEVELTKKSKPLERITEACLLGLHHLLNHEPVKYGCRIKKDAKVMLIGKSEIKEHLEDKDSELHLLIKES